MGQVDKYRSALKKQLQTAQESVAIEVVCLVGKDLSDWEDATSRKESADALAAKNIRVVTYQKLIKDAEISYESYLRKANDKGRIKTLLDAIEEN